MTKANDVETTTWRLRLKKTVAGIALAGALFGGVAVVADDAPTSEDTTEQAWGYSISKDTPISYAGWGISWR